MMLNLFLLERQTLDTDSPLLSISAISLIPVFWSWSRSVMDMRLRMCIGTYPQYVMCAPPQTARPAFSRVRVGQVRFQPLRAAAEFLNHVPTSTGPAIRQYFR
jgi:hypothetical protein